MTPWFKKTLTIEITDDVMDAADPYSFTRCETAMAMMAADPEIKVESVDGILAKFKKRGMNCTTELPGALKEHIINWVKYQNGQGPRPLPRKFKLPAPMKVTPVLRRPGAQGVTKPAAIDNLGLGKPKKSRRSRKLRVLVAPVADLAMAAE